MNSQHRQEQPRWKTIWAHIFQGTVAVFVILVVGVVVILLVRSFNTPKKQHSTAPSPAPTQPTAVDPVAAFAEALLAEKSLASALQRTKPFMQDTAETPSSGAVMLAGWMMRHPILWADVALPKDETSIALVQKDAPAERGKRLCVHGQVVEIHVKRTDIGTFAQGLLTTDSSKLIHFLAARSTGELVTESDARFCGVITGNLDYENSAGGVGHAVQVVGMFDLPANRAAPK